MKLVILGDLHLIAPANPLREQVVRRAHFAEAWPSFARVRDRIRAEAPDLVISVGDLVDWYDDANRDFALSLMAELGVPWVMTPGNHDLSCYQQDPHDGQIVHLSGADGRRMAVQGWAKRGIALEDRALDADGIGLMLLDSAQSTVAPAAGAWLAETLARFPASLLFTHVPIDTPETRAHILGVEPQRDLRKYVQSGAPWLYEDCLRGHAVTLYCGHLHFPGEIQVGATAVHLLPLATAAVGKAYRGMGALQVLHTDAPSARQTLPV